mmetsp:Transcript_23492/g.66875  ORF Transcript_23492/g.66875 Transcript_23492/m.66875 type:complete len:222 (-) Transcript_23492:1446-2111(-)
MGACRSDSVGELPAGAPADELVPDNGLENVLSHVTELQNRADLVEHVDGVRQAGEEHLLQLWAELLQLLQRHILRGLFRDAAGHPKLDEFMLQCRRDQLLHQAVDAEVVEKCFERADHVVASEHDFLYVFQDVAGLHLLCQLFPYPVHDLMLGACCLKLLFQVWGCDIMEHLANALLLCFCEALQVVQAELALSAETNDPANVLQFHRIQKADHPLLARLI